MGSGRQAQGGGGPDMGSRRKTGRGRGIPGRAWATGSTCLTPRCLTPPLDVAATSSAGGREWRPTTNAPRPVAQPADAVPCIGIARRTGPSARGGCLWSAEGRRRAGYRAIGWQPSHWRLDPDRSAPYAKPMAGAIALSATGRRGRSAGWGRGRSSSLPTNRTCHRSGGDRPWSGAPRTRQSKFAGSTRRKRPPPHRGRPPSSSKARPQCLYFSAFFCAQMLR
jgi:hypothetical protein